MLEAVPRLMWNEVSRKPASTIVERGFEDLAPRLHVGRFRRSGPIDPLSRCGLPRPMLASPVRPAPEAVIRCLVALAIAADAAKWQGSGSFGSGRSGV